MGIAPDCQAIRAIRNGFADCAAQITCSHEHPDIQTEYISLIKKLNEQPLFLKSLTTIPVATITRSRIDGDSLAGFVFSNAL
jgi:hypothetical protein